MEVGQRLGLIDRECNGFVRFPDNIASENCDAVGIPAVARATFTPLWPRRKQRKQAVTECLALVRNPDTPRSKQRLR